MTIYFILIMHQIRNSTYPWYISHISDLQCVLSDICFHKSKSYSKHLSSLSAIWYIKVVLLSLFLDMLVTWPTQQIELEYRCAITLTEVIILWKCVKSVTGIYICNNFCFISQLHSLQYGWSSNEPTQLTLTHMKTITPLYMNNLAHAIQTNGVHTSGPLY